MTNIKNRLISFKSAIVLTSIVLLNSCYTSSNFSRSYESKKEGFTTFEGNEFYISLEDTVAIEECLSENEDLRFILRNFDEKGSLVDDQLGLKNRQVVKRANIMKGLPPRLVYIDSNFRFGICVNNSGKVVLTRLVGWNQELTKKEQENLFSRVLDYEYAKDSTGYCMNCGAIVINYHFNR